MNWSEQIMNWIYFGGNRPRNLGYSLPQVKEPITDGDDHDCRMSTYGYCEGCEKIAEEKIKISKVVKEMKRFDKEIAPNYNE